jgi:hypothetical protein
MEQCAVAADAAGCLVLRQSWNDGLGATTNLRSVPGLPASAENKRRTG